jgi:hypothetical protein
VARTIQFELTRTVDRDGLAQAFYQHGFRARSTNSRNRPVLAVRKDGQAVEDLIGVVEEWVAEAGIPLVPAQVSDRVWVVRPSCQ